MGTKITYKSLGHDSKEDYRWVPKALKQENQIIHSEKELKRYLKDPEVHFVHLGRKDIYAVNKLRYKDKIFLLLEGNPVTYYFSLAYDALSQIEEARMLLTDSLKEENSKYKWNTAVSFSYVFKVSANAILFSFLSLEAFINQCLPDYAKISFEGNTLNKNYIQRHTSFENKFKYIIPKITQKDFINDHPRKAEIILELKKMRNELTHLKEMRKNGFVAYEEVYNHILNADLKKMVNTVKFYINYYKPKTIQNYKRNKPNRKKVKVLSQEAGEDEKGKFIKYYYCDTEDMKL